MRRAPPGMEAGACDIVLSEVSELGVALELSRCLWEKGYCVIDTGLEEDTLEEAVDDAVLLKRGGRFETPPEQLLDGILGPEGTRELAWLRVEEASLPARPKGGREAVVEPEGPEEGESLRAACSKLSAVVGASGQFCADANLQFLLSSTLAVRGGEASEEIVELTESSCSLWLTIFTQAKLMFILFLGPGEGTMELQAVDDVASDVELRTRRGTVLVLRADKLLHRHSSSPDDYALVRWLTAPNLATTRGWNEWDTGLANAMPAVRELTGWMDHRLQVIMKLEAEEKLDDKVPREWRMMAHHQYFRHEKNPVAIRGIAGHLPGQWDPESFWQSANVGVDYVVEIPALRWDHSVYYDPAPDCWLQSSTFRPPMYVKTNVRHGQFIDGCELFDTKFFGISVMEAKGMDPMQKHILETGYEALFAAGYKRKELMNNYIAVYTGTSHPEWNYIEKDAGVAAGTGASQAITSNRTSFVLGLMGPSSSIDCEMSSASVALMVGSAAVSTTNARRVATAANSNAAVVGGVYLAMTPYMWPRFNAWMNPNGRCFAFDQCANGYVRGEMCGSVCLKPYAERVDDRFVIPELPCSGCLRGWRMVSSGRAASLTAPHGPAEQECVHDAVRDACIDACDIDAVEGHGIGSLLDDSVEVTSLARVLRGTPGEEALALGSVKTHVGAQCEACGMGSLFKVVYNIAYASYAPSPHLKQLNPHIDLGDSSVFANGEPVPTRGRLAFNGFSSRGIGGTMVHGVVWHAADEHKVGRRRPRPERTAFSWQAGAGAAWPELE